MLNIWALKKQTNMTGRSLWRCWIHIGFKICIYIKIFSCQHLLPVNIYSMPFYYKWQHHLDNMHFINNSHFEILNGKCGTKYFSQIPKCRKKMSLARGKLKERFPLNMLPYWKIRQSWEPGITDFLGERPVGLSLNWTVAARQRWALLLKGGMRKVQRLRILGWRW